MNKQNSLRLIFILVLSISFIAFSFLLNGKSAHAKISSLDLINVYNSNVEVNKEVEDKRNAISIAPLNELAEIEFRESFVSDFSFTYSISSISLTGTISVEIESLNDNFEILLMYDKGTLQCAVSKFDELAAISSTIGNSTIYNRMGEYRKIEESKYFTLSFDEVEKTISIKTDNETYLVWDFSNKINDGKSFYALKDLDEFDVKISFPEFNEPYEFYLYDLNESYIGNGFIDSKTKPSLLVKESYESIKNNNYFIPSAKSYDLIDGQIEDIFVKVIDNQGEVVLNDTPLKEGLFFNTENKKYHKIIYSVTNSSGNKESKTIEVLNFDSYESANTKFNEKVVLSNMEVGINSTISLLPPTLESDLIILNKPTCHVALLKLNSDTGIYDSIDQTDKYTFSTTGTYKIKYFVDEENFKYSEEYNILVNENIASLNANELKMIYGLNEELNFNDALIYFNNDFAKANAKVIYPGGACFTGESIPLSELGSYEIIYCATINDEYYEFRKEITVINTIDSLFDHSENTKLELKESNVTSKVKGIHVLTKNNESITYNNIINLNDLSKDVPLLELMADVEKIGSPDFTDFNIYLVDAYDESNYILINAMYSKTNSNGNGTYIKTAASNGQILSGWYHSIQTVWGYDTRHSFIGLSDHEEISSNTLKFYFDNEELRLYSGPTWGSGYEDQNNLVADYDDTFFYGIPWKGFTTGEVILKISCSGALKREIGYTIKTICGKSLEDGVVVNTSKPEIVFENDKSSIPFGISNYEYKLFDAYAIDKESREVIDVDRVIYYNYLKDSQAEIPYEGDSFTPLKAGEYTIIYKATDKYKNTKEEIITINVYKEYDAIEFDIESITGVASIGDVIKLPDVSNIKNNSGDVKIEYLCLFNDAIQDGIIQNGSFKVQKEGTYKIKIILTDYLNRISEKELVISSSISPNPVLENEIVLPKYFLTEHKYTLPLIYARDYNESLDGIDVIPKVYVSDGINTDKELTNLEYLPINTQEDSYIATIKYVYTTKTGSITYSKDIKVIKSRDGKEFFMSNYFDSFDTSKTLNEEYITFNILSDVSNINFVNKLNVNSFEINFAINSLEFENLEYINLYLIDSMDFNNKVTLNIIHLNGDLYLSVNGKSHKLLRNKLFKTDFKQFTIKFNNYVLTDIVSKSIDSIDDFNFLGDTLYLEMEVKGTIPFDFNILSLNNQTFTSITKYDKTSPELNLCNFGGNAKINDVVTLLPSSAIDVLSDISDFTLIVKYENEIVKDINGVELNRVDARKEYSFVLNQYGKYTVSYYAKDDGGRSSEVQSAKNILVIDEIRPEISLNGSYDDAYFKGTILKIISANVFDNIDKDLTYKVYILNPNGRLTLLKTDSYELDMVGTYKVRYYAEDSEQNIKVLDFEIHVVEE